MNSSADYVINQPANASAGDFAQSIYKLVCRCDFSKPGFALLRQKEVNSASKHRTDILELKQALSSIHQEKSGLKLGWSSMSRFDQKNTTKFHRDGGPDQSLLILGYEPSKVRSEISIADYSKCAYKLGLSPEEFLASHNPMHDEGLKLLAPYTHKLTEFDPKIFQILILNNSNTAHESGYDAWQGVLHCAVVEANPAPRTVNSTSVCPMPPNQNEEVTDKQILEFLLEEMISKYLH